MAALDFPTNPTSQQVYTANSKSWVWNGTSWVNDSASLTLQQVTDIGATTTNSVGIGTTNTSDAKLEIGGAGEGIILASPDGTRYEINVANGGTLTVTAV